MNAKHLNSEVFCHGCGCSLGTGYKVQNRKYCDNACQQRTQREQLLSTWLETGVPSGWNGTGKTNMTLVASYIREHIADEQDGCCAICRKPSVWEGQPLVLILDHISGDSSDNSRGNLRLVCPNCNSQTPTFSGRNRGNGRGTKSTGL